MGILWDICSWAYGGQTHTELIREGMRKSMEKSMASVLLTDTHSHSTAAQGTHEDGADARAQGEDEGAQSLAAQGLEGHKKRQDTTRHFDVL